MKNHAALYLRSSKDRKDVSIQDQRELLIKLAADRGLTIVEEFSDIVESGKDEDRAGFQAMLAAIGNVRRGWDHLLCRDTARLARGTWLCGIIDYEAHKRGVTLIYANIPDIDPMTQVMLVQIYRAQDQIHSTMSRDKGLAGMRQNVMRGFRAGGRAPWGYQLKSVGQGIVRDGKEIAKTTLEPSADAHIAAAYLKRRATGQPRPRILADLKIKRSASSLIGSEWNALTYAGCTVWNVHRESAPGAGYKGQTKRRPREEWVITENTHPALITRDEAEQLIKHLQESDIGAAVSRAKLSISPHLLAGLLKSPEGAGWEINGKYYRLRREDGNKHIKIATVDTAVSQALLNLLRSDDLADLLAQQAQDRIQISLEPKKQIQARIQGLNATISKAMTAALMLEDMAPAMRKVDELEREKKRLSAEMAEIDDELAMQQAAAKMSRKDILDMLDGFVEAATSEDLATLVRSLVQRVTLDPDTLKCQINLLVKPAGWESMASPRGRAGYPTMSAVISINLAA